MSLYGWSALRNSDMRGLRYGRIVGSRPALSIFLETASMDSSDVKPPRKRSLTSMTLGWIAERISRAERIKEQVNSGTYKVDPERVAQSMVDPAKAPK